MEEWRVRQEIYHRTVTEHSDDLSTKDVVMSSNTVEEAVDYFYTKNKGWIYPAKSYMVGICYSKWLAELYPPHDPIYYLDNPNLLYANDPYFVPYSEDKETYDKILETVGWDFITESGMVSDVWCYFQDEFLLNK